MNPLSLKSSVIKFSKIDNSVRWFKKENKIEKINYGRVVTKDIKRISNTLGRKKSLNIVVAYN